MVTKKWGIFADPDGVRKANSQSMPYHADITRKHFCSPNKLMQHVFSSDGI